MGLLGRDREGESISFRLFCESILHWVLQAGYEHSNSRASLQSLG